MIIVAQPTHWERIKTIYIEGINTRNATFELAENVPEYEQWMQGKVEHSVFVYQTEGNIEGWAALSHISKRAVYAGVCEVSVYVSLNALGKGIGTALLQHLIEFAETNNIWTLQAATFPENKGSILLHKKHGFREVGTREKMGKRDGQWRDVVLLERRSKNII